jgi:hypothetical protein
MHHFVRVIEMRCDPRYHGSCTCNVADGNARAWVSNGNVKTPDRATELPGRLERRTVDQRTWADNPHVDAMSNFCVRGQSFRLELAPHIGTPATAVAFERRALIEGLRRIRVDDRKTTNVNKPIDSGRAHRVENMTRGVDRISLVRIPSTRRFRRAMDYRFDARR